MYIIKLLYIFIMKNILGVLRDKLGRFKSFKINLLDGQRRGEVVFRRVFLLVVLYIILFLIARQVSPKMQIEEAKAEEYTVEWREGDRITTYSDGHVEIVPKEAFMDKSELDKIAQDKLKADKIRKFFKANRGNAPLKDHAERFVEVANKYGLDYRLLPAIATMESGGGKNLFRPYNAWGYGSLNFKDFDEGIEAVGKGLKTGYIDKGAVTPSQIAPVYCPPNYKNWAKGVQGFMDEIEAL